MLRRALLALALAGIAVASTGGTASADGPGLSSPARHRPRPRPIPDIRPIGRSSVSVVDAFGRSLPTFEHQGRRFVLGEEGERYGIRITNPTSSRVEAVVSVDGLDAIDGTPASFAHRGYAIPPFGDVTIEGFRTSMDAVATFRFGSVDDSFAGRTGDARNVGVIGVAFFRERVFAPPPAPPVIRRPMAKDSRGGGLGSATAAPPASRAAEAARPRDRFDDEGTGRRGLGTLFGEERDAPVRMTTFERADSSPFQVSELRYDDRDGLRAMGIRLAPDPRDFDDDLELRRNAQPFPGMRFAQPPPR